MPNIEQVIRHALEKIDTSNNELREKVYRAAWETHERNIISDKHLAEEDRNALRDMLVSLIKSIENEYRLNKQDTLSVDMKNAFSSHNDTAGKTDHSNTDHSNTDHSNIVDMTTQKIRPHAMADPQKSHHEIDTPTKTEVQKPIKADDIHAIGPEELSPPPKNQHSSRQHKQQPWWRSNIILMILLVLFLLVAWAFYNGMTSINRPSDTANEVSTPPTAINEQRQSAQNAGWITVFDPTSINDFSIEGASKAQIISNSNTTALRLQNTNNLNDRVIIDVGEGIMEQLRGKTVTFNIVARSANDQSSQISIICDFGASDTCGKRIFDLHQTNEDLLFSVEIPQNINKTGQIFLQNALLGSESEMDIFAVRVRIEN